MATESLFVSSVQKELAEERRAVKSFVENDPLLRRFFTVFLFEDLPASDRRPGDVYLDEVDRCAVYVGLFGRDYGSEDPGGVSPTEHEFDRATAAGKPRLIFVKGDDATRHPKQAVLIAKAGSQLIRKRYETVPELTAAVYAGLVEHLVMSGRVSTRPFDASACPEATIDDISADHVRGFLVRARAERQFALPSHTPVIDVLAHLDLLADGRPTHAAVLLFGTKPQRFLPTSEVKCLHFHGTEVRKPIPSHQIYKGTSFQLVDQAVDFVLSKIDRRVGTRAESAAVPIEYELPPDAVREAIVNAVAHRDYSSNASVQVMLFSDRLEVWNPGHLPAALTFARLRKPHPSIPRNPLIAEPLFLAHYIEKAGSGTLDMITLLREAGLAEPEFRQDGGTFVQALRRPVAGPGPESRSESGSESGSESALGAVWWRRRHAWRPEWTAESVHDRVMRALVGPALSSAELAAALGHRARTRALRQALDDLRAAGFVERTIPERPASRNQRYRSVPPSSHP